MPKRSANDKIERYERKIRKLRERHAEKRRKVPTISSDSSDNEGTYNAVETTAEIHNSEVEVQATTPPIPGSDEILLDPPSGELNSVEPDLDPELLEALGESTSDNPEFGDNIHENLAKLWLPLLQKGLPKEKKDLLLKDYLIPDNCRLLQAPKLNAEISAAIPDMVRNRDKLLNNHQQQLGCGITAINRALNLLLSGDEKKHAIQHLSNACRILSDLHYINTSSRIKLLTPSLDKSFLHVIQDAERDETLFGNHLSDNIKSAKAIEKQGLLIKKAFNSKVATPQASRRPTSNSVNWSAPARYQTSRGGRGGKKQATQNRRQYPNPTQQPTKSSVANRSRESALQYLREYHPLHASLTLAAARLCSKPLLCEAHHQNPPD